MMLKFMTRIRGLSRPLSISMLVLAYAGFGAGLRAQETTLTFDPAQAQINFTTSDTIHTVHGAFKLKQGSITFDPATGKATGQLVVDSTSEDTGSSTRDRKVRKDVLESQTYPEIVFVPDRLEGAVPREGDFDVKVHGAFRIHGGDHDLTLTVHAQHKPEGLAVLSDFDVPYQKWGMKNPSTLFIRVSDTVHISVHAVARSAAATSATAR